MPSRCELSVHDRDTLKVGRDNRSLAILGTDLSRHGIYWPKVGVAGLGLAGRQSSSVNPRMNVIRQELDMPIAVDNVHSTRMKARRTSDRNQLIRACTREFQQLIVQITLVPGIDRVLPTRLLDSDPPATISWGVQTMVVAPSSNITQLTALTFSESKTVDVVPSFLET